MHDTLWFIHILKDEPWWGILIGFGFFLVMFLSKNLVVYLYSRNQAAKARQAKGD